MLQVFLTQNGNTVQLESLSNLQPGAWIHLTAPSGEEMKAVVDAVGVPDDYIAAALDEEERPRLETENGCTLILFDVPFSKIEDHSVAFSTVPLGIVITQQIIVTICLRPNPVIEAFEKGRIKGFFTFKKTRFLLQILSKNSSNFLIYLRQIEKISDRIEDDLHRSMRNEELVQLLNLEKSLVYFSTSLRGNEVVLERIRRFQPVKMYEDDNDLLEDVIIENRQAIEMANIYSNILNGMMDVYSSIVSNNLNIVMKFLTSVTIILAIPTMVASFFGMNVLVPFENDPMAFIYIFFISLVFSVILTAVMWKKRVL